MQVTVLLWLIYVLFTHVNKCVHLKRDIIINAHILSCILYIGMDVNQCQFQKFLQTTISNVKGKMATMTTAAVEEIVMRSDSDRYLLYLQ